MKTELKQHETREPLAKRFVKIFDKISARVAIVLILVLTILYFVAAKLNPDNSKISTQEVLTKNAFAFIQESIIAVLPVFILFVFSYWLLRELDEYRRKEELEAQAERVAQAVRDALVARPLADKFFNRRSSENLLVEHAERELLLVQETGSLLFEQCKVSLTNLLKRGGVIRMIVVDSSPQSASLLAYRNANMNRDAIASRASQLIAHLQDVLHSTPKLAQNLEVRFCPYPVCSTSVIVDKNHDRTEKACALIRLAGFRIPFDDKLDFQLSLDTDPATFVHYVTEFENLWKASSKILFITGEPECGKTTLLAKLQGELAELGSIYFCMSKATIDEAGKRTGFETVTSYNSIPRQIAVREVSGIYKPNLAVIDDIAAEIELASQKCRLLIIDEIGPIQLQSAAFADAIKNLLEKPSASVIASIALDDSKHVLLKKFKTHFRPNLVHLEKQQNDQSILEQMHCEVESLLRRPAFYEEDESENKKIRRS